MESDRDHLTRLSKEEIASFDALFVRYYPLVLQFIVGFVKNREDARDLLADFRQRFATPGKYTCFEQQF